MLSEPPVALLGHALPSYLDGRLTDWGAFTSCITKFAVLPSSRLRGSFDRDHGSPAGFFPSSKADRVRSTYRTYRPLDRGAARAPQTGRCLVLVGVPLSSMKPPVPSLRTRQNGDRSRSG
jgi:hypothetical protein